jgi:hypothetical protein
MWDHVNFTNLIVWIYKKDVQENGVILDVVPMSLLCYYNNDLTFKITIVWLRVIVEVSLLSLSCPFKNDVTFKIIT